MCVVITDATVVAQSTCCWCLVHSSSVRNRVAPLFVQVEQQVGTMACPATIGALEALPDLRFGFQHLRVISTIGPQASPGIKWRVSLTINQIRFVKRRVLPRVLPACYSCRRRSITREASSGQESLGRKEPQTLAYHGFCIIKGPGFEPRQTL